MAHTTVRGEDLLPHVAAVSGWAWPSSNDIVAVLEHNVGRALDEADDAGRTSRALPHHAVVDVHCPEPQVARGMDRRHALAIGVERDLGNAGEFSFEIGRHRPALAAATTSAPSVGSPTMRQVRLPASSPLTSSCASLHRSAPRSRSEVAASLAGSKREVASVELALRACNPSPIREIVPPGPPSHHGHLILGQRARLVGADHRGAAERLDGGQLADRARGARPCAASRAPGRWSPRRADLRALPRSRG